MHNIKKNTRTIDDEAIQILNQRYYGNPAGFSTATYTDGRATNKETSVSITEWLLPWGSI